MTKKYEDYTREQLLEEIKKLKKQKKFGLVWEDKPEQVVEDCKNNFPVLTEVSDKAISEAENSPTHLIIEGDNFHSLSVLNVTHKGKIDVIYIDPPYNTGKADEFMYNDKYVDINDGFRHSKWLSFMHKRLELAKELLTDKGVIFLAIDDNEVAQLKLLCNQIFGEDNFITQFIRKNKAGAGHDSGQIAVEFDYMLCFAKNKNEVVFEKEILDVKNDSKYKLEDDFVDYRGKFYLRDLDYKGSYSESGDYPIITPDNTEIYAGGKFGKPNTWRWSKEKLKWGIENDYIVFKKVKDNWKVYIKQYQFVDNENNLRERKLPYRALIQFLNSDGSQELNNVLQQNIFKFPKSTALIEFCINLLPNRNLTVLDFFAGSGTTGHAVLKANHKDKRKRQFIICTNNENKICEEVTYKRIEKVIFGYKDLKGNKIDGIPANLRYFKTDFIEKSEDTDENRISLTKRCYELLQIKESCYESQKSSIENLKIWRNDNKLLAVIFDRYDKTDDQKYISEIMDFARNSDEIVVYRFSIDGNLDMDISALKNARLEAIPEEILKTFNLIFKSKKKQK